VDEFIAGLAIEIRRELAGGRLCGKPIDWDDPDMALVAAYYGGRSQEYKYLMDLMQQRDHILAQIEKI